MNSQLIGMVVVSILVGGMLGFGIAYGTLHPLITELQTSHAGLQTELTTVANDVDGVNASLLDTQADLDDIDSALTQTTSDLNTVNSTVATIENRTWHLAYERTTYENANNNKLNSTVFEIQGEEIRIRWRMEANFSSGWMQIVIFYQNGSMHSSRGSTGTYNSFANDLKIIEPGMYFVGIVTSGSVDKYLVVIWDYY